MICPDCGKEMERGKLCTSCSTGVFFLPPEEELPTSFITRKGIERRGGVVLDGPFRTTLPNESDFHGWICRSCRKIVMGY